MLGWPGTPTTQQTRPPPWAGPSSRNCIGAGPPAPPPPRRPPRWAKSRLAGASRVKAKTTKPRSFMECTLPWGTISQRALLSPAQRNPSMIAHLGPPPRDGAGRGDTGRLAPSRGSLPGRGPPFRISQPFAPILPTGQSGATPAIGTNGWRCQDQYFLQWVIELISFAGYPSVRGVTPAGGSTLYSAWNGGGRRHGRRWRWARAGRRRHWHFRMPCARQWPAIPASKPRAKDWHGRKPRRGWRRRTCSPTSGSPGSGTGPPTTPPWG